MQINPNYKGTAAQASHVKMINCMRQPEEICQ